MSIFNSLGSNYNFMYVLRSLFKEDEGSREKLIRVLEKKYQGSVGLPYKGRQAITIALNACNLPEKSGVGVNSFTCVAVIEAIQHANLTPIFLDCELDTLNFTPKELKKTLSHHKMRVVIIQNTLGYPCDIEGIQKICNEEKLILIEDLAHSIGTIYKNGAEAGTIGDFTILSFGQDKVVDAVSGGAVIARNPKLKIPLIIGPNIKTKRDMIYPALTFVIRRTYSIKVGKAIHFAVNKLGLLINPMRPGTQSDMSDWHAMLALNELLNLDKNLSHRRMIASIYIQELDKKLTSPYLLSCISTATHLKLPLFLDNREKLIKKFKNNDLFLSNIWYRFSVTGLLTESEYPHTSQRMKEIINLPTHTNVSAEDARLIAGIVNSFVKNNDKNT